MKQPYGVFHKNGVIKRLSSISVLIHTLNEEKYIEYAIRSVQSLADEIIVVDMYSDDKTVEIAERLGAKVFFHERMGYADPARAFAISKATCDWIFVLDADEIVPPTLADKLKEIANDNTLHVAMIPRENYLLGSVIHAGWDAQQDIHPRMFKRGYANMNAQIHNFMEISSGAKIRALSYDKGEYILHFNYVDLNDFIERLNRYTSIEAQQMVEQNVLPSKPKVLYSAFKEFAWRYWKAKGYKDGWKGFYLCLMMAFYKIVSYGKACEIIKNGGQDKVEQMYFEIAESQLM